MSTPRQTHKAQNMSQETGPKSNKRRKTVSSTASADLLLGLPDDVLVDCILNFLDRLSVCRLVSVCKQLRHNPTIDTGLLEAPGRPLKFQNYFCMDDGNPIAYFAAGKKGGILRSSFHGQLCHVCSVPVCRTGSPDHFCSGCFQYFCIDCLGSLAHTSQCFVSSCPGCDTRDVVTTCTRCDATKCFTCFEGPSLIVCCGGDCGDRVCSECGIEQCNECGDWSCDECDRMGLRCQDCGSSYCNPCDRGQVIDCEVCEEAHCISGECTEGENRPCRAS